jgi:MFS transporter, ACS family, glucarate transporter
LIVDAVPASAGHTIFDPGSKLRATVTVKLPIERPTRIRWVILTLLTSFSLVSYIERINLSVASRFIRDEFRLTDVQIGWSFSAFLVAYTVGQIPSGYLADRFGSRAILSIAALAWFGITVVMGAYLGFAVSTAGQVLVGLILLRILLGLAEAPTFPALSNAGARWFPASIRGTASAIVGAASYAGQALTLIVLGAVIAVSGWRSALFLSAVPALVLSLAWWWLGRSTPSQHPYVNAQELDLIRADPGPRLLTAPAMNLVQTITQRDVLLLSMSYFFQGYVIYLFFFWFYIYLVDVRGFSIAAGGLMGALPTISAAVCNLAGGWMSDTAARRWGWIAGRRRMIVLAGLIGGAALLAGAFSTDAAIAIGCFAIAIGTRGLVESAYWSIIIDLTDPRPGAGVGMMNMMANLGGAVSTALAPVLVRAFGWPTALAVAALLTAASGLLLYGMQADRTAPTRAPVLPG